MSNYGSDDDDVECAHGELENEDRDILPTNVCNNSKSFRRRIEEREESKWLRSMLDDI
jgi:hypothetical protein